MLHHPFLCTGNVSGTLQLSSLLPPLCASISITAVFTFMFGLLVGVLLTKCVMKLQATSKSVPQVAHNPTQMPIYEEVPVQTAASHVSINCKVEDNVAYGPINFRDLANT